MGYGPPIPAAWTIYTYHRAVQRIDNILRVWLARASCDPQAKSQATATAVDVERLRAPGQ